MSLKRVLRSAPVWPEPRRSRPLTRVTVQRCPETDCRNCSPSLLGRKTPTARETRCVDDKRLNTQKDGGERKVRHWDLDPEWDKPHFQAPQPFKTGEESPSPGNWHTGLLRTHVEKRSPEEWSPYPSDTTSESLQSHFSGTSDYEGRFPKKT